MFLLSEDLTPQPNSVRYAAYLYNTYTAGLANDAQRAGLQLAIWNVLNDKDFSVTTGVGLNSFVATGSVAAIAAAESYLSGFRVNSLRFRRLSRGPEEPGER